jgi:putative transposase
MPRQIRYIIPGISHHAVQRGNNRQQIFFDKDDREVFLSNIKKYSKEQKVLIGAYCLMTNHIHLLLYPENAEGLIKFMKCVSQNHSQYINRKYKRSGKLWENRYKLHIVDPDYEWVVMRYIERNSLRAKIVAKAEEYFYSSAKSHLNGVQDKVLTKDVIENRINEYRIFFSESEANDIVHLNNIRANIQQEKPLGDKKFIEKLEVKFKTALVVRRRGRPSKKENK